MTILKSLVKNIIAIVLFFAIPFLGYRSCTSGYDKYVYYVHVKNEAVFEALLDPSDARIITNGRQLKDEIVIKDAGIDNGSGAHAGKLRWYVCRGIDCDEGWENSFLTRK